MGHGHGHGDHRSADVTSASGRHVRALWISFGILVGFAVLELVVGLVISSLALLSDAAHMVTDVLGVGMALAAITAARGSSARAGTVGGPSQSQRTFGLYRAEVLAALANSVLLVGVAVWVTYEAIGRFSEPPEIPGLALMLTAAAGLVANLAVFAILRAGAEESLNVRGAYLEVLADTFGSIGVLIGGALMLAFGWWWVDPVVAIGIGVWILPRTWQLGRQALRILVQVAPGHIDVTAVTRDLHTLPGVDDVHDLHVWTLTSGMEVGSVHLRTTAAADPVTVLTEARSVLAAKHHLEHVTVQVEPPEAAQHCAQRTW